MPTLLVCVLPLALGVGGREGRPILGSGISGFLLLLLLLLPLLLLNPSIRPFAITDVVDIISIHANNVHWSLLRKLQVALITAASLPPEAVSTIVFFMFTPLK